MAGYPLGSEELREHIREQVETSLAIDPVILRRYGIQVSRPIGAWIREQLM